MSNTTVAWGSVPSRKAADQAVQRLVASGFARNSIDLTRHDEDGGYDLAVHTRHENRERAERLMQTSATDYVLQKFGSQAMRNASSHPIAVLGAGLIAGAVLFTIFQARQAPQRRSR